MELSDELALRGFRYVWRRAGDGVAEVGRIALMVRDVIIGFIPGMRSFSLVVQQMQTIGVGSLGLVAVVSLFTGAVAAVQAAYQFSNVVPMKYLGAVIIRSVVIELGPVLTALVVGGRVGASIAAELGTMRVTEQIDALEVMAIHPVRYLVVPRIAAALVMLPVVTVFANAIGVFGGWVVAVTVINVSSQTYVLGLKEFFHMNDLYSSLLKAFFFGGIIGTMGCFYGFAAEGGAEGVGLATTRAVVASCVLVLISDYVLANVLLRLIFRVMIAIRGLAKKLGNKRVLAGIDLDIASGESVVVMGRSGTGKSVLLKHIVGLMQPDAGTITIDGRNIVGMHRNELNTVRQHMGMLFQSSALFDSMTVGENVGLMLREHTNMTSEQIAGRVRERLDWVGLEGTEKLKPASLSGGMRKRVGLARAIVMDPTIILYDEPTTGLDPITADVIDQLIRSLQKRLGASAVVVTHDLSNAYKVADRIAMLHEGRVVFTGTVDETRGTTDPMVRQFIEGSSTGPIQV